MLENNNVLKTILQKFAEGLMYKPLACSNTISRLSRGLQTPHILVEDWSVNRCECTAVWSNRVYSSTECRHTILVSCLFFHNLDLALFPWQTLKVIMLVVPVTLLLIDQADWFLKGSQCISQIIGRLLILSRAYHSRVTSHLADPLSKPTHLWNFRCKIADLALAHCPCIYDDSELVFKPWLAVGTELIQVPFLVKVFLTLIVPVLQFL